jgi:hypothetical protein
MNCDRCGWMFAGVMECYDGYVFCANCHQEAHASRDLLVVSRSAPQGRGSRHQAQGGQDQIPVRQVREGDVDRIPDEWKLKGPWIE